MRTDGYLSDYCDGYLFKNHSLFRTKPNALQLILYFDELEICNPLGSHSGVHKLGMIITFLNYYVIHHGVNNYRHVLLYVGKFATGVTLYSPVYSTCGLCHIIYNDEIWICSSSQTIHTRCEQACTCKTSQFSYTHVLSFCMQAGIVVQVDGKDTRVYGTVLVLLADTLAAHQLGGFKVGVGFSLRKCRQCMVTFDDMQTMVSTYIIIFRS